MFCIEPRKPKPDLLQLAAELYEEGYRSDQETIDSLNKIEGVVGAVLAFTLLTAYAQQKYYPLPQPIETIIQGTSITPLPFVLLIDGLKQQQALLVERSHESN